MIIKEPEEQYSQDGLRIFNILNEMYIKYNPLASPNNYSLYKEDCKKQFLYIEQESGIELIKNDLFRRWVYRQLHTPDNTNLLPTRDNVIPLLKSGGLVISEYGRGFIDQIYRTDQILENVKKNLSYREDEIKKEINIIKIDIEKSMEKTRNTIQGSILAQVITIMSIFVAVIVLIFQGMGLLKNPEYILSISSCERLKIVFFAYLPILIAIAILFVIWGIIFKRK